MEDVKCIVCGRVIPCGRLDALPGVQTCVLHSDAKPVTEDTPGVVDGADVAELVKSAFQSRRDGK